MPKILCIDDNQTNRIIIGRILDHAGFALSYASDGESGVTLAKTERPDLILMDIELPGIDGFEATRRIKADSETSSIPVIALSAHEASDKLEEIAASGCDGFMTKPLDFETLIKVTYALIAAASSAAKAEGCGR